MATKSEPKKSIMQRANEWHERNDWWMDFVQTVLLLSLCLGVAWLHC